MPVASEDIEDLFAEDATKGNEELAQAQDVQDQTNLVDENTHHKKDADPQE